MMAYTIRLCAVSLPLSCYRGCGERRMAPKNTLKGHTGNAKTNVANSLKIWLAGRMILNGGAKELRFWLAPDF
jgi:hypothetical protein